MLIFIGLLLFGAFFSFYFFKTSKEMPKNWYQLKTEFRFLYIGFVGLIQDFLHRSRDHVELYKQPGRTAVITGGNRGIGLRIVEKLLKCEMTVIMGVRDIKAAEDAVGQLIDLNVVKGKLICEKLDISDLTSVINFAKIVKERYPKIDVLLNNAGIMFAPFKLTKDGFESHLATNYLGHFLLTHLLMPNLKAASNEGRNSRIVNVSSIVNLIGRIDYNDINGEKYYYPATAYNQSKLAQILFTRHLNRLLVTERCNVQVTAVHPGVVDTDLFEYSSTTAVPLLKKLLFKNPEQGSRAVVYAAIDPSIEGQGGSYMSNCGRSPVHRDAKSPDKCEKLFNYTCKLLKIEQFGSGQI